MGDEHWEKLEKPNQVDVDLKADVEPPEFPEPFIEAYGDLMRDFTKALADLAHAGDAEGLGYIYRYMTWITGRIVREVAMMKSGKPKWN